MLNSSLRGYKKFYAKAFLQLTHLRASQRHASVNQISSCLCGTLYYKHQRLNIIINNLEHRLMKNVRVHSTQSDQHRQKAVIETTTPKIVIDKISLGKVLPHRRAEAGGVSLMDKIDPYVKLARWDKPIGVYLLYWPCAWSIALGSIPGTVPLSSSVEMAALFLVGAGLMRGAGCTINDLWDRDIDKQVERTRDRPLVSGAVSAKQAVGFLAAQLSLALLVLLQLNCYSVVLGASSMLLVITYPLAKRFTNYPQIFLGATFNWGALLGYASLQGAVDWSVCAPLYTAALAWTLMYDTIYAHQDKLDDARIGIKSTALTFGSNTKPALSAVLAGSVCALAAVGHTAQLGVGYWAAVATYVVHAGRQIYTLDPDNPNDCAKKFKSNSLVGLIILLGIISGGYENYLKNREKNRGKEDMTVIKSCVFS